MSDALTIQEKAPKWYERYAVEVIRIGYATLAFQCCRNLSQKEAEDLLEDIKSMLGLVIDCEPEELIDFLQKSKYFRV